MDTQYGMSKREGLNDIEPPIALDSGGDLANTDSSWILIYIDLLTLLLTMFVLMLSYAKTDMEKFRDASEAIAEEISQTTGDEKQTLSRQLLASITESGMAENIEVLPAQGTVELRMREQVLFASGFADLTTDGKAVLRKLTPLLQKDQHFITVEGHTDNVPIATQQYPTNWELSAARATQVVRFLIANGIDSRHTRAIGYADTKPVADNHSIAGRSQNRRVSLIIEIDEGLNGQ
jgi:chemotaxis protein MotB